MSLLGPRGAGMRSAPRCLKDVQSRDQKIIHLKIIILLCGIIWLYQTCTSIEINWSKEDFDYEKDDKVDEPTIKATERISNQLS